MDNAQSPKWKTRLVVGEFPDRDFDIEFWQEQPFRLHDRIVFDRDGDAWRKQRLFP